MDGFTQQPQSTTPETLPQERSGLFESSSQSQRRAGVPSLEEEFVSPSLPEEWGGRPAGTSRRARRMQAEWDAEQKALIDRQSQLINMRNANLNYELSIRDQQMQEDQYWSGKEETLAKRRLESQMEAERRATFEAINKLDPRSSDYRDRVVEITRSYPLGMADQGVQTILGEYEMANKLYLDTQKAAEADSLKKKEDKNKLLMEAAQVATATGKDIYDFVYSDPETEELVVDPVAFGKLKAEAAAKPAKDESAGILRQESKEIRAKVRDIDQSLIEVDSLVVSAGTNKARKEAENKRDILRAQRAALVNDAIAIDDRLSGGSPAAQQKTGTQGAAQQAQEIPVLTANDEEAYDALPAGAEFIIDGRRRRKPPEQAGPEAEATNPQPQEEAATERQPIEQPAQEAAPATPPQPKGSDTVDERRGRERKSKVDLAKEVGSDALARDVDDVATLEEELDNLNKKAYRFSSSKRQRDLYASVAKQLADTKKSRDEERKQLVAEKRKRMKEIGPFSGSKEFDRLSREVELLSSI